MPKTQIINIKTPDGMMPTRRIGNETDPVVIVFTAADGITNGVREAASRLSDNGYYAIVPDLYYRWGEGLSFDAETQFDSMVDMATRLSDQMVVSDVEALLGTLNDQPVGAIGFCQGGRFVVRTMAAYPARIVVGSALHPSHLFLEGNADSPHLEIAKITGQLYLGFGAADSLVPPKDWDAVRDEVAHHGTHARIDAHSGADHGFMMTHRPTYQAAAAEACWDVTFEMLRELHQSSAGD